MGTTTELREKLRAQRMEWKDQSTVHERSTAIRTAAGYVYAYTMNDNLGTLDVEIDSITPDQVLDVVRALNPDERCDKPSPKHMADAPFPAWASTANAVPTPGEVHLTSQPSIPAKTVISGGPFSK